MSRYINWGGIVGAAVIDQGIFSSANFVVSIQLARWMSPENYGAYSYAFSLFLLMSGFYTALFLEPMSIFGPVRYRGSLYAYLRGLSRLHVIWSLFSIAVACLAATWFSLFRPGSRLPGALYGFGLSQGMMLYCWFVRRAWYIEHRVGRAVSSTSVYAVALIGGTWVLHLTGTVSPFAAFLVNGGAGIAACWSFIPVIAGTGERSTESIGTAALARENWKYGRWLLLSSVLYWLTGNVYYVLTGSMLSLADAGALRALQNLTNPVLQVVTAFGLLFMPWISRRFAEHGRGALKKGIFMFSAASTAIALAFFILILPTGKMLVQILYTGRYLENAWLLPYLALVPVTVGLTSGWMVGLRVLGKTSSVFLADTVGALLTLTVGVALVRGMGLTGAAIGIVLGSASRVIVLPWLWGAGRQRKEAGT